MQEFPELSQLIQEATQHVEDELAIEDEGWIRFSTSRDVVTAAQRIGNIHFSRLYSAKDPLGKQSIRLWTDYTFGTGMKWQTKEDSTKKVLEAFWKAPQNQAYLSARGQRRSSDRVLIDGEIFFAIFLGAGGAAILRSIDPLEITEIVTDPDDIDMPMYYHREWTDAQGHGNNKWYRSTLNPKGESAKNAAGLPIGQASSEETPLIYHLALNTITQRGNPLLLPALDWIRQYRRFLASRVAIMLALARFAWKMKVQGGATAVAAEKSRYDDKEIPAASMNLENMGADLQPIRTDSNARNAYEDGRMLKLQVCASVGISEQYYGDIATGNLATAKTVELPMLKMFQSYQAVWKDTYEAIDNIVLAHNGIAPDKWYIDRDFPPIAPEDVALVAASLAAILPLMPELSDTPDVQQIALMTLGINNPAEVLDALTQEAKKNGHSSSVQLVKALNAFKESLR